MEELGHWLEHWAITHPIELSLINSVVAAVVGFLTGIYSGHLGNKKTERENRETFEGKQSRFIDALSSEFNSWITTPPEGEKGIMARRRQVAIRVKELSKELFDKDYPEVRSVRTENTEYGFLPCKWCHSNHQAYAGSRGDCTDCKLPMDYWVGAQGKTPQVD